MQMKNMTKKDKLMWVINKIVRKLNKVDPKIYVLVVSLVLVAILVKKYRAKIFYLLRMVLNV